MTQLALGGTANLAVLGGNMPPSRDHAKASPYPATAWLRQRFRKDLADYFPGHGFNHRMSFTVEHLGLPARDPNALQEWYRRVLGAKLIYDNGAVPQAFFIHLDGGMMLEIFEAYFSLKETGDNRLAGWRHLALRVDSIEKSRAELEGRGVVFKEIVKPAGGGGNVLFFSDPEGNLLHLVERPANSVFDR